MPKEHHVGHLNRGHIKLANSARNFWCVTPVEGVKVADLCNPEYWKHVATEIGIQANDRIEATCQDGSWWAEYLVLHVGPHSAKLQILRDVKLDEVDDSAMETDNLYVTWISPYNKFGVRRKSDKAIMKDGFAQKSNAIKWMADNAQSLAA